MIEKQSLLELVMMELLRLNCIILLLVLLLIIATYTFEIRPDGKSLEVPPQKVMLQDQPKKGDIVSISFDSFSRRALPTNPKIYRIRTDVSWQHVVWNFHQETKASKGKDE